MAPLNEEELKAHRERQIFRAFCESANLMFDPGSITSKRPPLPDIEFSLDGEKTFAELVEITDQAIARMWEESRKTGRSIATSYSSSLPLADAFKSKSQKNYETDGHRLHLLAYYEKQSPVTPLGPDFFENNIGKISRDMIHSGKWHGIWLYDHWNKNVLWGTRGEPT